MTTIQKVALLGKGFLGSAVLKQLVEADLEVTVFTRSRDSVQGIPAGVAVAEVDYSSIDSLRSSLCGHDAVVSTVTRPAVGVQKLAIDASILAGVKRFIPADFGAISTDPKAKELPNHIELVEIQNYLRDKASAGEIEYTFFAVGPFLDFVTTRPLLLDYANHHAVLYDEGQHPFSTTSVATIGKAVAAALKRASDTKNRIVYVHDVVLTQRKLLALAKKASPGVAWTESNVDSGKEHATALDRAKKEGIPTPPTLVAVIRSALLSGKYNTAYSTVDNELLGLGFMSDEELESMIAAKN